MKIAAGLLISTVLALGAAGCVKEVNEADYSDSGIKERLELDLRAKKGLDLRFVTVDVHSGVVTLSGMTSSYEERDTIGAIAKKLSGVEQVIVNLIVQE